MKKQRNSRLLLGILVITILTLHFAVLSAYAIPVVVEPFIDAEGPPLNKVFVLPLQFLSGALPPDEIGRGLLVASIIIVAAFTDKIYKMMNTTLNRLIGHYKGPPRFFVSLASLVRNSVIDVIAEIVSSLINISRSVDNRYNMVATTLKVTFTTISGELRTVSGNRNIHTFRQFSKV